MEEEWTDEACLKLIIEYKKQPILWDFNHPNVYSKQGRLHAWQTIGKIMNCDPGTCKRKMVVLLSSFRRSKSKMLQYLKVAGKSKELVDFKGIYQSTWYRFKELSFLLDKDLEATELKGLWDEVHLNAPENLPVGRRTRPIPGPKIQTCNTSDSKARQRIAFTPPAITPEIEAFTAYIAAKMSKYSEKTKNMVQQSIFEAIWKADQTEFHDTPTDSPVPNKMQKLTNNEAIPSTSRKETSPKIAEFIPGPKIISSSSKPNTLTIIPEARVRNVETTTSPTKTAPTVTMNNFTYVPSSSRSPSPIDMNMQSGQTTDTSNSKTVGPYAKPNILLKNNHQKVPSNDLQNNIITPILNVTTNPTRVTIKAPTQQTQPAIITRKKNAPYSTNTATSGPIISNVISMHVPENDSSDETSNKNPKNTPLSGLLKEEETHTKIINSTALKIEYESDEDILYADTEMDYDNYVFLLKNDCNEKVDRDLIDSDDSMTDEAATIT